MEIRQRFAILSRGHHTTASSFTDVAIGDETGGGGLVTMKTACSKSVGN
jgi:hypothetical protein